jgi:hypothetical protein
MKMGKRGPKPKEKPVQPIEVVVQSPEPIKQAIAVKEAEKQLEAVAETKTALTDCWRYSATGEKKIFKAGESIPAGWEDTPAKFAKE